MRRWTTRATPDARQYAPAAERNAGPILAVLGPHLPPGGTILEIGSGTGQHVIALAAAHPELRWQPSDPDPAARASIAAWTAAADLANVGAPLDLDVTAEDWTRALERPLQGHRLHQPAPYCAVARLRGPHGGRRGAARARRAALSLRAVQRGGPAHCAEQRPVRPVSAHVRSRLVRDLEAVVGCAADCGLEFVGQSPMPANNLSVILRPR